MGVKARDAGASSEVVYGMILRGRSLVLVGENCNISKFRYIYLTLLLYRVVNFSPKGKSMAIDYDGRTEEYDVCTQALTLDVVLPRYVGRAKP